MQQVTGPRPRHGVGGDSRPADVVRRLCPARLVRGLASLVWRPHHAGRKAAQGPAVEAVDPGSILAGCSGMR